MCVAESCKSLEGTLGDLSSLLRELSSLERYETVYNLRGYSRSRTTARSESRASTTLSLAASRLGVSGVSPRLKVV